VACFNWWVRVPRGPVKGFHVAPRHWFDGLYTKFWLGVHGGRTRDLPRANGLTIRANHSGSGSELLFKRHKNYMNCNRGSVGGNKGWGLAPALANTYDRVMEPTHAEFKTYVMVGIVISPGFRAGPCDRSRYPLCSAGGYNIGP
jgi:hypothetical protein